MINLVIKLRCTYNRIKSNKILGINFTKEAQNEYLKTPKYVEKKISINKWENISISWIRKLNIVEMTLVPPKNLESQHNTYHNIS